MPYMDKNENVCGFLDIEEKDGSNVFLRKYFLLDRRKNILECYMDNPLNLPEGSQPVNQFNLCYMSIVGDGKRFKPKEQFCFYFTFAGKNVFLRANDALDKENWIEKLKDSAKVTVSMRSPCSDVPTPAVDQHKSTESDKNSGSYMVEVYGDNIVIKTDMKKSGSESDIATDMDSVQSPVSSVDTWNPYSQQNEQVRAGYCTKQGQIRKSWKRRYFVLTPISISYYKESSDKEAIKSIALADVIEARISVGIHLNREHVFEIVTGQRVFYVQTDTAVERDAWTSAINHCIDRLRKPRPSRHEAHSQTEDTLWGLSRSLSCLSHRKPAPASPHGNHTPCPPGCPHGDPTHSPGGYHGNHPPASSCYHTLPHGNHTPTKDNHHGNHTLPPRCNHGNITHTSNCHQCNHKSSADHHHDNDQTSSETENQRSSVLCVRL